MVKRASGSPTWAAWGLCLVAGCLSRGPGASPLPQPAPVELSAPADEVRLVPPPAPPPPTDYGMLPVQPVARVSSAGAPPIVKAALKEDAPAAPAPAPAAPAGPVGPPRPPAPVGPVAEALRAGLEKHPAEARKILQGNQSDRELLLALLRLTTEVGAKELDKLGPDDVARTLDQVRQLQEQLRGRASLRLERALFCRRIQGFGQYEPQPAGHAFRAGWEGRPGERVQVYAEVRNFTTACRNGAHETALQTRLEIREAGGRRVAALDLGTCVDRCRARREDYFLNIQFNVPAGLTPGLYTLWVVINDTGAAGGQPALARAARRSLDFRVSPPGSGRAP